MQPSAGTGTTTTTSSGLTGTTTTTEKTVQRSGGLFSGPSTERVVQQTSVDREGHSVGEETGEPPAKRRKTEPAPASVCHPSQPWQVRLSAAPDGEPEEAKLKEEDEEAEPEEEDEAPAAGGAGAEAPAAGGVGVRRKTVLQALQEKQLPVGQRLRLPLKEFLCVVGLTPEQFFERVKTMASTMVASGEAKDKNWVERATETKDKINDGGIYFKVAKEPDPIKNAPHYNVYVGMVARERGGFKDQVTVRDREHVNPSRADAGSMPAFLSTHPDLVFQQLLLPYSELHEGMHGDQRRPP